jgi:hypothetical protein
LAPVPATPPAPVEAAAAANNDGDETIDVSSVLGDLLQEPTEPPPRSDAATEPHHGGPAPDPRVEPTLNFAFNTPVPPVHEPTEHAAHSAQTSPAAPSSPVHFEQPRPHAPPASHAAAHAPQDFAEPDPRAAAAATREREHQREYYQSMYDDGDTAQMGAAFRPKRSLLTSPVLRMSAFVIVIAALAIVVILAVSGVWDPRGPQLDLPPRATSGDTAPPSPAPPLADVPASIEPVAPSAVNAQTPTPDSVPAPSAAPTASAAIAATPPPTPAQTSRESSAARRRGSPAEPASSDPRSACAGRTQFALYRCMQTQCALPRWAAHPECVRLRKSDRVDPP